MTRISTFTHGPDVQDAARTIRGASDSEHRERDKTIALAKARFVDAARRKFRMRT
jgi:hypothetical protein